MCDLIIISKKVLGKSNNRHVAKEKLQADEKGN